MLKAPCKHNSHTSIWLAWYKDHRQRSIHSKYRHGPNPVSEMTCTVSCWTLNSTIPYHTIGLIIKIYKQTGSQSEAKWQTANSFDIHRSLSLSLSLHFNSHFPGKPGLASVYWSKGWWKWWWQLDYWSYRSCKAPVKSSPPTNQHPILWARCPSFCPTNSVKALKGKYCIHGLAYSKLTWGSSSFVSDH